MSPISFPKKPRFLIVSLRYIGDVLLSTPLALSIKAHLPEAQIDYLVFKGTEGVLAKNPHVRKVHTVAPGIQGVFIFLKLLRRYDFSISTNSSDRTVIFTLGAGRRQIGFSSFLKREWWKEKYLSDCNPYNHDRHIVPLMLTQLKTLGIPAIPRVVMGFDSEDQRFAGASLGENYLLLHPYTRQSYKYWPVDRWVKLAGMIEKELKLKAFFTRTRFPADEEQLHRIRAASNNSVNVFPEPFSFSQLAAAIHGSRGFVGVDTVGTHMAAALEVPVIALFGPTFADIWGPWPNSWKGPMPYQRAGRIQSRRTMSVIQREWPCVPCGRETCHISQRGKIECMEELSPEVVLIELQKQLRKKEEKLQKI